MDVFGNTRYYGKSEMKKRKFTWDCWDFDLDGCAYVIAKDECGKENLADYICSHNYVSGITGFEKISEGWCAFQVRRDWDNEDVPNGGYVVEICENKPKSGRGWFPVWIIRDDDILGD